MMFLLANGLYILRMRNSGLFLLFLLIGCLINFFGSKFWTLNVALLKSDLNPHKAHEQLYSDWLHSKNISRASELNEEALKSNPDLKLVPESLYLHRRIRILCYVVTYRLDDSMHARNIVKTWGKRCNKLIFFGTSPNFVPRGQQVYSLKSRPRDGWEATKEILYRLYNLNFDTNVGLNTWRNFTSSSKRGKLSYDWYIGIKPNTYLVVDNLRYLCSVLDPDKPHYLGQVSNSWGILYNDFKSGVVLSRGALNIVVPYFKSGKCDNLNLLSATVYQTIGDIELGRCLAILNISPVDTRDKGSQHRFLNTNPEVVIMPGNFDWLKAALSKSLYPIQMGTGCCSDYAVTFHNIDPFSLLIIDFFLYKLYPYGLDEWSENLPPLDNEKSSNSS